MIVTTGRQPNTTHHDCAQLKKKYIRQSIPSHLAHAYQGAQNILPEVNLVLRMLSEQERLNLAQHCHHIGRTAVTQRKNRASV